MTSEAGYYDDDAVEIHKQAQTLLELCECNAKAGQHYIFGPHKKFLGTMPNTFREEVLDAFEEMLIEIRDLKQTIADEY